MDLIYLNTSEVCLSPVSDTKDLHAESINEYTIVVYQ